MTILKNNYIFLVIFVLSISFNGCSSCSRSALRSKYSEKSKRRNYSEIKQDLSPNDMPHEAPRSNEYKSKRINSELMSVKDIVRRCSKAVFLIYTYTSNGDGKQGTGFFVNESGVAVSNYHVFDGGDSWAIKYPDGSLYRVVEILKLDKDFDLVVFKVDMKGRDVSSLNLTKSDPEIGDDVIVIGNPQGLERTVTKGIISSFRNQNVKRDVIQIDAAISPGSSGSPVLNMYGNVVGIATMKVNGCENCNYAFSWRAIDRLLSGIR